MQFNGFHHIGLFVKDIQKSLNFYTKGLGGKEVHSFPMTTDNSKTVYLVDLGNNATIELIPKGNDEDEVNSRWVHVSINTDNPKAAYDMAIKAGAVSRSEPNEMKLGTMAIRNAFVYGPDREVIEFFQNL